MLKSRMFAPSCIVKNSKLGAKALLSSMFPYKSLRNGYIVHALNANILVKCNYILATLSLNMQGIISYFVRFHQPFYTFLIHCSFKLYNFTKSP